MPWKECSVVEERLRFIARLLDGEAMTDLCREFGISRKTGYKILDRYQEHGLDALTDRSRRPVRYANQLPQQIEGVSSRAIRSRTAATSACTSPSRRRQPARQAQTACSSRTASTPSFTRSMLKDRTRRSP
jgi:hypothetical protein